MSQIGINDLNVFTADTPAVAEKVSENFTNVKTAHNDTDLRVSTLEVNADNILKKDGSVSAENVLKYKTTSITLATNASPIVITAVGHKQVTGNKVNISGALGNTAANGNWIVTRVDADRISLDGSTGNGTYTSGGVVIPMPSSNEDIASVAFIKSQSGSSGTSQLGIITSNITLVENTITYGHINGNYSITLPAADASKENICIFDFTTVDTGYPSITNTNILKKEGKALTYSATTSSSKTITGASNTSPIIITTSALHNYKNNDAVTISSVAGNTAANGTWVVTRLSDNTFSLNGSTGNGTYTSGGTSVGYQCRNRLTCKSANGSDLWEVGLEIFPSVVEVAFTQPTLSADGTLGGSNFAVYASTSQATTPAWQGSDNNSSTDWSVGDIASGYFYTWYNPNALKLSAINITNRSAGTYAITGYTVYGSSDNTNWTTLKSGTNSTTATGASWSITLPNTDFYKYTKLYVSASNTNYAGFSQGTLVGTYLTA